MEENGMLTPSRDARSAAASQRSEEKMSCRYTPTIMDGPVVRFEFGYKEGTRKDLFSGEERIDWSAEINASRNGVSMNGRFPVWSDAAEVYAVQDMLAAAYEAHKAIRDARDPHEAAKQFVEWYYTLSVFKTRGSRLKPAAASEAPCADAVKGN